MQAEKIVSLMVRASDKPGVHDISMMIEYSSEPTIPIDIGKSFVTPRLTQMMSNDVLL